MLSSVLEIRNGWRRWAWLLLSLAWIQLCWILDKYEPEAVAYFGVSVALLAWLPVAAMLAHVVFPSLLTWLPIAGLVVAGAGFLWWDGVSHVVGINPAKMPMGEKLVALLLVTAYFSAAVALLFYLKPRRLPN